MKKWERFLTENTKEESKFTLRLLDKIDYTWLKELKKVKDMDLSLVDGKCFVILADGKKVGLISYRNKISKNQLLWYIADKKWRKKEHIKKIVDLLTKKEGLGIVFKTIDAKDKREVEIVRFCGFSFVKKLKEKELWEKAYV